jgi:hypothetical protein
MFELVTKVLPLFSLEIKSKRWSRRILAAMMEMKQMTLATRGVK